LTDRWNDIINVFEDERMETLLANYYHDVDFKSNVYRFNGLEVGEIPTATNKFQQFYNLVRFRSGTPERLARVAEIIKDYNWLTRNTGWWGSDGCYLYYKAVMELYSDLDQPESPEPQFDGDVQQGADGIPNGESQANGEPMQGTGEPNKGEGLTPDQIKELIGSVANDKTTNELVTVFQTILDGFSKKNKSIFKGYFIPKKWEKRDWCSILYGRRDVLRSNLDFIHSSI
jgi:hypothetical protein